MELRPKGLPGGRPNAAWLFLLDAFFARVSRVVQRAVSVLILEGYDYHVNASSNPEGYRSSGKGPRKQQCALVAPRAKSAGRSAESARAFCAARGLARTDQRRRQVPHRGAVAWRGLSP